MCRGRSVAAALILQSGNRSRQLAGQIGNMNSAQQESQAEITYPVASFERNFEFGAATELITEELNLQRELSETTTLKAHQNELKCFEDRNRLPWPPWNRPGARRSPSHEIFR